MNPLLDTLRAVCARAPIGEKLVVAPSLAVGHQILDALAMSGTPWVNLRIETVRTIADAAAAFDLAQREITVLSRAQALMMIERACDRALDASSYFAALAGRPGLHRAIQRSLDDLRHAGITADAIPPAAFEDARKAADLAAILRAYEEDLSAGRYIDRYGVLARAVELLGKGARPWPSDAIWLVLDDSEFTAKEGSLVALAAKTGVLGDAAARGHREPPARTVPLASPAQGRLWGEALGKVSSGETLRNTPSGEGHVAQTLLSVRPGNEPDGTDKSVCATPSACAAPRLHFRRAIGEENEIRGVFRRILEAQAPFDDAELVYTTRDPYLPLAFELASEVGVPCTFAEGLAAHFTRPGQAAIGFLEWLGNGWQAWELQKIARAGAIDTGRDITPSAFARALRNAAIGWGVERYLPRLDSFIEERRAALAKADSEGRRAAIERILGEARGARAVVARIIEITSAGPVAPGSGDAASASHAADDVGGDVAEPSSLARAAADFVATFAAIRNDADAMARDAIVRVLRELADVGAGSPALPRDTIADRLAGAVRAVHVNASNPRPGHLHIAPVSAAGWNGRATLFVAGLDAERHPGRGLQDPVVLDAERDAINGVVDPRRLQLLGDAPARAREQLRKLLSRSAARDITLSYASLGLNDRRERFPSHSLVELFREATGRADATHEDVAAEIARDGFVDAIAVSDTEWWLHRRFGDGDAAIGPAVMAEYPLLASGMAAEAARDSEAITKWDGLVEGAADDLDPRKNGRVYSASQLENLASCPYGHFLRRILRIEPLEERRLDPDVWLQAHEFGSLMHEVLEETMSALCDAHTKPSLAYLPRMQQYAAVAVERWRLAVPPPNDAALDRQKIQLFRSCEMFLRTEEEACRDVTSKYFELSFGFGQDADIAMPDPLVLDLGGGRSIRLRGRIDRVDHDEAKDEWHVWDYKSGSTFNFDKGGSIASGRRIQHALYARALEAMLARKGMTGKVTRSGYFFPTPKGRGARVELSCSDRELSGALNHLFDTIANGFFPHAGDDACRFCDFATACGSAKLAGERTTMKLAANVGDPAVAAWIALQEVG